VNSLDATVSARAAVMAVMSATLENDADDRMGPDSARCRFDLQRPSLARWVRSMTGVIALSSSSLCRRAWPLGGYLTIVGRAGVWPDSVQVFGWRLSLRLPTSVLGVALFRFALRPGTVAGAWLQRGLPCSQ
jgi:hypothetical protein